ASPVAAAGDPHHRGLRRRHHSEPGPLLAVRDGDTDVHLLRVVDHRGKGVEAMSPPRRRRDAYRPPRSRREVLTAAAAGAGALAVPVPPTGSPHPNHNSGPRQPGNSPPPSAPQAPPPIDPTPPSPPSSTP